MGPSQATALPEFFKKTRFEHLEDAIKRGDTVQVREHAMAIRAEYVPVHDGFRDTIALTLAWLVDTYGDEEGEAIGREVVEKSMEGGDPPQYSQAGLRDRVKAIALGWHWHATRFSLSEDDERITFRLHPCGSGMRLVQEGIYGPGPFGPPDCGVDRKARLPRSKNATRSTFMTEGFPIYCNHCSEMGHVSLKNETATFLVEGWTPLRKAGQCLQHTYKDVTAVPDEFYRRAGLPLPERIGASCASDRLFTDAELLDLQTHPVDRLIDGVEKGDVEGALEVLQECLTGWRDAIHDVYRLWPVLLWNAVHERSGEKAFEDVVRATAPDLFAHIRGSDASGWAVFWMAHLRPRALTSGGDWIEYSVEEGSLLAPGELQSDLNWFVARLNEGLQARGWSDVGRFAVAGGNIVHRLSRR